MKKLIVFIIFVFIFSLFSGCNARMVSGWATNVERTKFYKNTPPTYLPIHDQWGR